jgi:hypothetical protein
MQEKERQRSRNMDFQQVMMVLQGHCCHHQAVVEVSPDV